VARPRAHGQAMITTATAAVNAAATLRPVSPVARVRSRVARVPSDNSAGRRAGGGVLRHHRDEHPLAGQRRHDSDGFALLPGLVLDCN
jgi:hypothetical protein